VIKFIIQGWIILIVAIAANAVVDFIGLKGWYEFLSESNMRKTRFVDYLWLFILYPCILGAGVWLANALTKYLGL
tara:strand:+ start:4606 stop:4830 length:225 start_codon:yes stop_codon:yes gene_type:complete